MFSRRTRVAKIHDALKTLIGIYESVGRTKGWPQQFSSALEIDDEATLCRRIQGWYGGMGSLNDQFFCRTNGDLGTPEQLNLAQMQHEKCIGRLSQLSRPSR